MACVIVRLCASNYPCTGARSIPYFHDRGASLPLLIVRNKKANCCSPLAFCVQLNLKHIAPDPYLHFMLQITHHLVLNTRKNGCCSQRNWVV